MKIFNGERGRNRRWVGGNERGRGMRKKKMRKKKQKMGTEDGWEEMKEEGNEEDG